MFIVCQVLCCIFYRQTLSCLSSVEIFLELLSLKGNSSHTLRSKPFTSVNSEITS